MPYLNLDDNYPDHPKVEALSDTAYRLHGAAMFYAAKFGLDGYLTQGQIVGRRGYRPSTLRELIAGDLLHDKGDGCGTKTCPVGRPGAYLLHDFLQWNKPKEWWDQKRIDDAKRKAEWRAAKAQKNAGVTA